MYSATGRADWWTRIHEIENKNFSVPCEIQKNKAYQIEYIYNFKLGHEKNHTMIIIEVQGYTSILDVFKNSLRINNTKEIKIISIDRETDFNKKNIICN